jgi:hypothetical protein
LVFYPGKKRKGRKNNKKIEYISKWGGEGSADEQNCAFNYTEVQYFHDILGWFVSDLELEGDLMTTQQLCHLEMMLSVVPYFSTPIHIESTVEQSHYIHIYSEKEGRMQ